MPSAGNFQIDKADAGKAIIDAPPPASLAADDALNNDSSTNNQHQQQASVHFQEDKVTNRDLDNEFAEAMPNPPAAAKASITISPTPKKKSKNVGASSSTKKSKGKPSTTPKKNTTSAAAVATPSSSAEKAKKKGSSGKKKSEPKKPSTTLHSFFGKAGPSKKSSSSNTNSCGAAKIAAVKAKLAKEAADTDAAIKISVGDEESATKDNKATTKTKTKKKPSNKTKGDNSGGVLGGDDTTSTAKKSKKSTSANKKKSIAVDAPSTVVVSDNNQDEELDDAPARVVQIASRTHSAAAGGIKRRNSRGSVSKGDKIAASSNGVATSLDGGDAKNEEVVIERVTTEAPAANKSDSDDKMETDDAVDNNNSPKPTVLDEVDDEDGKNTNTSADKLASEAAVLNDVDGSADGNSDANSEDLKELGDLLESPEAASEQCPSSTSNRVSMSPEQLPVAAADTNGDEEGSNTSEMLVEITDNVEQNAVVDMDTQEDLAGDPNLLSLLGDIPDANDEAPVQQDIVDDDDAATVEVDEEAVEEKTNTSVGTESVDKGVEKKDEPSVVDVPKESVTEELSVEQINTTNSTKPEESSNDEVIVINNPTGSTKKAAGDTTKKEKKKVKDPNAPKRNKTAYNYYSSASRNDVKTANPSAKPIEITKLISENWKALSAEEKAPWDAKAAADKERYQKEMAEYTSKGGATKSSTSKSPKPTPSSSSKAPKKESKGMNNIASLLKQQAALSPKKKSNTPKRKSPSTTVLLSKSPAKPLSEENATRLRKYTALREKYVTRATELGNRPTSDDFEEESLCLDGLTVDEKSVELAEDGAFPDKLLNHLQLIVQGRSLPLSDMANKALVELSPFVTDDRPLTIESISAKIKLLAERKSYLSGNPPSPSEKPSSSKLDCFENAEECYLWRWELSSIDLLPQKEATKVKKARSMRKKLQSHHKSIINLITAVDKAITWLQNSASSKSTPAAGEKLLDKIPTLEEKVLKYEREEETARLKKEAKLQEDKSKTNELEEKQRKKAEAAKEREEAKRKKTEEKERKKNEEMEQKLKADEKKKKHLMSFFNSGGAKKKQKVSSSATPKAVEQVETSTFDSKAFCKLIDSQDEHVCKNPFEKISPQSKASRRRKTNKVRVSVFVTVLSENAFAPQPYDEEKVIIVNNRYKFLGFHEDVRPPYRGTWSKLSSVVTGRRPYGKDTTHLDYENDSEAEWEEGDDEEGEDLADGDDGVDEEDDMQNEEDNDGWLAAEDDLGIEDDDDDTIALRKKNLSEKNASATKPSLFKACVIAPRIGGLSHESFNDDDMQCVIEGFTPKDAMDALTSHVGCIITPDVGVCLDAFPPVAYSKDTAQTNASGKSTTRQNKAMSPEAKKIMAQFVHNTTYKSKDVLLTELLSAHPNIANSRTHAKQELDVLADKLDNPHGTGKLWEVKEDLLKKLGLKKKDLKKAPVPKEAKEAKVKDPNAPKRNKTAYNYYSSATRNDVKTANPAAKPQEIGVKLGENWKALSAEEKAPWDAKAAADKERYQKEMAEYTNKGGAATSSSPKPTPSSSSKSPKKGATETKGMNIITSLQKQAELSPKAAAATAASSSANADESQAKKPSSAMKKRKEPASSFNMFANFVAKGKKQKTT